MDKQAQIKKTDQILKEEVERLLEQRNLTLPGDFVTFQDLGSFIQDLLLVVSEVEQAHYPGKLAWWGAIQEVAGSITGTLGALDECDEESK